MILGGENMAYTEPKEKGSMAEVKLKEAQAKLKETEAKLAESEMHLKGEE